FSIETALLDRDLVERLEEALAALSDSDLVLRARLLARLAIALYWTEQGDRRKELCEEARGIADKIQSPEAHLHSLPAMHAALWSPFNLDERLQWSAELTDLSERLGDRDTLLVSRCFRIANFLEHGDMQSVHDEVAAFRALAQGTRQPECLWMS